MGVGGRGVGGGGGRVWVIVTDWGEPGGPRGFGVTAGWGSWGAPGGPGGLPGIWGGLAAPPTGPMTHTMRSRSSRE